MEPKVILRFTNASKAGTSAEFPVKQFRTINIGRDNSCEVAYDSERDDLVSRLHAKIAIEAGNPPSYLLTDCESRNGTFLNHQRITSSVRVTFGDVIQLGPGGPEILVEMDPRPAVSKPTRLAAEAINPPATVTRDVANAGAVPPSLHQPPAPPSSLPPSQMPPASRPALPSEAVGAAKQAVGKQTIERMIADSQSKSAGNLKRIIIGVAAAAAVFGGTILVPGVRDKVFNGGRLSAAELAKTTGDSVIYFEAGWKLVDTESGRSLYHWYVPNKVVEAPPPANGQAAQSSDQQNTQTGGPDTASTQTQAQAEPQTREIVPGGPAMLPAFTQVDGVLEPVLTTDAGEGGNKPIGGQHSGSGFVVSPDGFILTNRHVAATWMARYDFAAPVGVLVQNDGQGGRKYTPFSAEQFPQWLPYRARFIVRGRLDPMGPLTGVSVQGKAVEGRNDYLDVTFPKNRERVQAKLVRISDQADVAMVKIDMPRPLQPVGLHDNYESIAQGDEITVMGYPAVSPMLIGTVRSSEAMTPTVEQHVIPDPTLSVGNIGRIIRGKAGLTEAAFSQFGDVYQLTVTSTGAGNSGGPVFDSRGRVIGLFTYGSTSDVRITFAVPIRYGMELMGTKPVM